MKKIITLIIIALLYSCKNDGFRIRNCGKYVVKAGLGSMNYGRSIADSVRMVSEKEIHLYSNGSKSVIMADFIIVAKTEDCK